MKATLMNQDYKSYKNTRNQWDYPDYYFLKKRKKEEEKEELCRKQEEQGVRQGILNMSIF